MAKAKVEGDEPSKEFSIVTFLLRSGAKRSFSFAEHGENYKELAAEFEKNNLNETDVERKANRIDNIVNREEA